jgi:hypothetical protein
MVAITSNSVRIRALLGRRGNTVAHRIKKHREKPMGAVMIRCPQTGREIETGMTADRERFRAMPVFFGQVYCPICRTEHEWFAQEAWVCEGEPERRQGSGRLS